MGWVISCASLVLLCVPLGFSEPYYWKMLGLWGERSNWELRFANMSALKLVRFFNLATSRTFHAIQFLANNHRSKRRNENGSELLNSTSDVYILICTTVPHMVTACSTNSRSGKSNNSFLFKNYWKRFAIGKRTETHLYTHHCFQFGQSSNSQTVGDNRSNPFHRRGKRTIPRSFFGSLNPAYFQKSIGSREEKIKHDYVLTCQFLWDKREMSHA